MVWTSNPFRNAAEEAANTASPELEEGVWNDVKRAWDKSGGWRSNQAKRIRKKADARYAQAGDDHNNAIKHNGRSLSTMGPEYRNGYMGGKTGKHAGHRSQKLRELDQLAAKLRKRMGKSESLVAEAMSIDRLSNEAFGIVILVVSADHHRDELDRLMYHNGSVNAIKDFLEAAADSEGEHLSPNAAYDAASFIKDNWQHIDDIGLDEAALPALPSGHYVRRHNIVKTSRRRMTNAIQRGDYLAAEKHMKRISKWDPERKPATNEEMSLSEENPDGTSRRFKAKRSYHRMVARNQEKHGDKIGGQYRRDQSVKFAKQDMERDDRTYAELSRKLHGESVSLQEKSLLKRIKRIVQAHTPGTAAHTIRQIKKPSHKGGPSLFGTDKVSVDSRKWAMRMSNDPKEYNAVQKSDDRRHRNEKQRRIAVMDRIRRDRDLGRKG